MAVLYQHRVTALAGLCSCISHLLLLAVSFRANQLLKGLPQFRFRQEHRFGTARVTAGTLAYNPSQHSSLILPVTQSSLRRATAFLFELRYREHRHVRASVLMCVHGIRRGLSAGSKAR